MPTPAAETRVYAYADPPYVGQARRHYGDDEINHKILIDWLVENFPDGWALSASSPSLHTLLPLCPQNVRVAAWVKPFAIFKPGVNPAYAWEPVIVSGGRKRERFEPTVRDWVSCNITLRKGLVGVKPTAVAQWLLQLLGVRPGDVFVDVFPGSGAVGVVAEAYGAEVIAGGFCD